MCGIVGAASRKLSPQEIMVFEDLMIISNLRGRTGAGIVTVTEDKKAHSTKVLGSGIDAINHPSYNKRLALGVHALIGHTRFPTKGGTDIGSVHPHNFEKIIGVHNGTLRRVEQTTVPAGVSDSALLYKSINDLGLKEAIQKAEGAYALTYLDLPAKTLNFIRNYERPMWFAKKSWNLPGKTLFWASERAFLELALGRAGMKNVTIEELPVNEHWSLPIPMNGHDLEFTKETGIYANSYHYQGARAWHSGTFLERVDGVYKPPATYIPFVPDGPKKAIDTTFGKETYVWREGRMVAKSDPSRQVTLPAISGGDEHKGATKNEKALAKAIVKRVSKQQREKAAKEIQNRTPGLQVPHLKVIEGGLSQAELDFNDDVQDLFTEDDFAWHREDIPSANDDEEDESKVDFLSKEDGLLVQTVKGHWVTTKEREKLLLEGCAWTGNPANNHDVIYWISPRDFVSEEALMDPDCLPDMAMHYPACQLVADWKAGKIKNIDPPDGGGYYDITGRYHPTYVQ